MTSLPLQEKEPRIGAKPLIQAALAIMQPIGALCAAFGVAVLAAYAFQFEPLYRPIPGGPATHPLTATVVLLLGVALYLHKRPTASLFQISALFLAALLTSARLIEVFEGVSYANYFTPFLDIVAADHAAGLSNSMGINSALMLFLITLAVALRTSGFIIISQIFGFVALAVPMVSIVGYTYGLEGFYGQMSLLTASLGFILALAAICSTANEGAVQAVLSPYVGGIVARYQITATLIFLFGLGYLIVRSQTLPRDSGMTTIFIVVVCWFIIVMINISAVYQEFTDAKRRRSERRLAMAATTDPLTGLPNRRKFFEYCEQNLARSERIRSDAWVLMIDIDRFKRINDTAGHAVGDRALIKVAHMLNSSGRTSDLTCRFGGEEFAIMLLDTTRAGAERVGNRILQQVKELEVEGWPEPISVSIGCAESHGNETLDETLHQADLALYHSKNSGRDRMTFIDELAPEPLQVMSG